MVFALLLCRSFARGSDALRLFQALAVQLRVGSACSRTVGNEKLQMTVSEPHFERLMQAFFWSKRAKSIDDDKPAL